MSVDKFNHEGYFDLTTYGLLPTSTVRKWQLIKRLPIFLWCMCAVRMQVMLKTTWQMQRSIADCVGNSGNCLYPNKNVVTDEEFLSQQPRRYTENMKK